MLPDSNFELAYFTIRLRALSEIQMPVFQGALFRGSFGKVFRRVVCMQNNKSCQGCSCSDKCPYAFIFESLRLKENIRWQASHDPHPYVLEPPCFIKHNYAPGEEFSLGLVLIGEGIKYLPFFVLVFEDMGLAGIGPRRGHFEVVEVVADDLHSGLTIFCGTDQTFINDIPRIGPTALNCSNYNHERLRICFITPVRLQQQGKIATNVDFIMLLRALLRRYSWLSTLYCGELPELPYGELLKTATEIKLVTSNLTWCDLERYSHRQDRYMKLGGLVGEVVFEGPLLPYLSLLKLGEYLHIGKGTAFGLGKYRCIA